MLRGEPIDANCRRIETPPGVPSRLAEHTGGAADMSKRRAILGFSMLGLAIAASSGVAQDAATFGARLDWVPISGAERNDVGGTGGVTARLTRSRLEITGCFEGLPAAATSASVHQGVATGARGPAIAELTITPTASGTVSGGIDLTREQRAALLAGHFYIQLHAARGVAPDNAVLWGWLLTDRKSVV